MQRASFFSRIWFSINSISLRNKIFLAYAFLLMISMAIMGYFLYSETVKTANEQVLNSLSDSLQQSAQNIQNILDSVEKDINLFSNNNFVQDILIGYDEKDLIIQYDESRNLIGLINTFQKTDGYYEIRLHFKEPKRFLNDNEQLLPSYKTFSENDLIRVRNYNQIMWKHWKGQYTSQEDKYYLSCIKRIIGFRINGEELGIASFDVREQTLNKAMESLQKIKDSNAYMVNGYGETMAYNGKQVKPVKLSLEMLAQADRGEVRSTTIILDDTRYLRVFKKVGKYSFYIVDDVPMQEITSRGAEIFRQMVLITSVILLLSFAVAYAISEGITRRMKNLTKKMKTIDCDNFEVYLPVEYNDEVSILTQNFNRMIRKIKSLVEDVYKANLEKKEAEIRLLQAQINPHFLYNTLNTVNWLAIKANSEEICYIVNNLSDFLRLGLNKGDEMITLEKELKHVLAYFNIQKYRFQDRIHLHIHMPQEFKDIRIISLTLQPLVENAIIHGILKEGERQGNIDIKVYSFEDKLVIEVSDDGDGMKKEELDRVVMGLNGEVEDTTGFGLRNVHQRIKIKYGDEYGLNILSEKGMGTKCIIIFPAKLD